MAAVNNIDPRWKPKIDLIVCGKRHHTRFFATSPQQEDRTGNLPSGSRRPRPLLG